MKLTTDPSPAIFYRVVDVSIRCGRQNAAHIRAAGKAAQKSLSPTKIPEEFLGSCASATTEAVMPMFLRGDL